TGGFLRTLGSAAHRVPGETLPASAGERWVDRVADGSLGVRLGAGAEGVIMGTEAPQLVFGDDGSAAADVVWLWVNNHRWPGWRISVVTAVKPPLGAPVGTERSTAHPWEPPTP